MDRVRQSDHSPQPSPFQTSFIGYSDSITIHGGTFTQHISSPLAQTAFEELIKAVARAAFHNSAERFDPPKCHPRTRLAITERIMNWIQGKESTNDLIMWLHGPAGSGKSAIAQRIAELCHDANLLLASFFCSRSDSRRNCAKYLVPTIAYQIARAFPGARTLIEREIVRDPLVFDQSLETQMIKLIVNPLQPLIDSNFFSDTTSSPRLIILDGLDEVINRQEQTRILKAISNVLRRNHVPLIFLIASRPEQEISYTFNSQPLSGLTARLILDATFHPEADVRIFLDDSFSEIKANHPLKNSISSSWPPSAAVDQLVRKSSGQFIYAATVIRFAKSIRHRPADRLDIVLGLRPVHRDLPFAELDALYMHILSLLEYPDQALQIIGAILTYNDVTDHQLLFASVIEKLFGLEVGDVDLYLADMTSLVSWDREGDKGIRILHASFGDFLFDPSRSGAFTMDRKAVHTMMACHCLRHVISASVASNLPEKYWENQFQRYAIAHVAGHLSRSSPSSELMDLLRKLSFENLIGSVCMHLPTMYTLPLEVFFDRDFLFRCIAENIFNFVTAIQALGLDQSEYCDLRCRLFDQVVKKELETYHSHNNSLLQLLLCLRVRCSYQRKRSHPPYISRWDDASRQLTDWNTITSSTQQRLLSNIVFPASLHSTSHFESHSDAIALSEFLQDASRAGKFVVDAEAYANASLSCLKYLSRLRSGAHIKFNVHQTRRNPADRRNTPFIWKQRAKLVTCLPVFNTYYYVDRFFGPNTFSGRNLTSRLYKKLGPFRDQAEQQQIYLDATHLALVFLRRALPRSAKSDDLVTFIKSEKPFSQLALQFPAKLKKVKAAMAFYLARIRQESGAPPSNAEE